MNDDALLLRRYSEEGSEAAFTSLVRRHVDLVYGAALRRTGGDPHRAAEVAQQVFVQLARRAAKLARHPVLSAWLHTATRNAALNLMISDRRRQQRETEALALGAADPAGGTEPDWNRLRPCWTRRSTNCPSRTARPWCCVSSSAGRLPRSAPR